MRLDKADISGQESSFHSILPTTFQLAVSPSLMSDKYREREVSVDMFLFFLSLPQTRSICFYYPVRECIIVFSEIWGITLCDDS